MNISISTPFRRARTSNRRVHGWAWVGLTLALALHVLDEASHDFLALYNPVALRVRQAVPFLPMPVFTFRVWLAGLIGAIVLLLGLSLFVFKEAAWTRGASYLFGAIMLLNGCSHILGSSTHLGFWLEHTQHLSWFLPPSLSLSSSREGVRTRRTPVAD